ncbi:MAG: hypothetical protein HOE99_09590 [Acidiferrobacteraceae bacterium]|nr:hypothetical protein [Acidiferrobacteraceae bacterium]MBT5980322.1 hypothetical protein [Acidiferrobacteraceae bacterium]
MKRMESITPHCLNARDVQALDMTTQVICLSECRLHRLMGQHQTGLNPQLVPRPELDVDLVVVHKACIDLVARVRLAAQPMSLLTSETSVG